VGKAQTHASGLFAEKVIDAVARNKAVIIEPSWWKIFWLINRLSPSLGISLAEKRFRANVKALSAE